MWPSFFGRAFAKFRGEILYFRNGSITIGGRKLTDLDLKWWRSQIGLVQQEPFLFNQTIFENVAHGLVGTEWEDADLAIKTELVKSACKEAYADEFISRLPDVIKPLIELRLPYFCILTLKGV